jgi:hypothetical protein
MTSQHGTPTRYDLPTAVTFMLAGVAFGSILMALFSPVTDKGVFLFRWLRPR